MTVPTTLDAAVWLRNFLEHPDPDPDLMRALGCDPHGPLS